MNPTATIFTTEAASCSVMIGTGSEGCGLNANPGPTLRFSRLDMKHTTNFTHPSKVVHTPLILPNHNHQTRQSTSIVDGTNTFLITATITQMINTDAMAPMTPVSLPCRLEWIPETVTFLISFIFSFHHDPCIHHRHFSPYEPTNGNWVFHYPCCSIDCFSCSISYI